MWSLKRPVEHVANDSSHKEINVLNRVMEDVFICIGLSEDFGDFKKYQNDWPDLNLNWLIDYCFYYFTAWLSGYMYMFFMSRKAIWVTKTPFQKLSDDFGRTKEKCGRTRKQGSTTLLPGAGFWSVIGIVFEGTTRVFERIYREKWVREKEEICEFEKD